MSFRAVGTFPAGGTDLNTVTSAEFNVGEFQPLTIVVEADACVDTDDCGDSDTNGIRDDVCAFWECQGSTCVDVGKAVPADMGSPFGACPRDNFCNIHDRNHALTEFAGLNSCASINIDAGSSFGQCPLDGFANIHDANHALTCFAGTNACLCGPTPEMPAEPTVVGEAALRVVATQRTAKGGDLVEARVFIDEPLVDLQSYQLHLETSGGRTGQLVLEDIVIENRRDAALSGGSDPFDAVNVSKSQMLAGEGEGGVATKAGRYLATYIYRVSTNASGTFMIDVMHDESNLDQTFLVSNYTAKVEVTGTVPATIDVRSTRRNGRTR